MGEVLENGSIGNLESPIIDERDYMDRSFDDDSFTMDFDDEGYDGKD